MLKLWFIFSECWYTETHERPTFMEIIDTLEEVKHSSFVNTPQDSFHTMQEDWRLEIEEMFVELRAKEQVMFSLYIFLCSVCIFF